MLRHSSAVGLCFNTIEYDGLFISNGPGDPDMCDVTVEHIRKAMNGTKPIFGICMGNQLLSKAGGARTYKLKYGHRSHNQPVRQVGTKRCFIHLSESWFCSRIIRHLDLIGNRCLSIRTMARMKEYGTNRSLISRRNSTRKRLAANRHGVFI